MSYETRAYDQPNDDGFPPNPVVVLVATGTHDVSRLMLLLSNGNSEQCALAYHLLRQVRRHNGGRAALKLLAEHGGPDLLAVAGADSEPTVDQIRQAIADPGSIVGRKLGPSWGRGKAGYAPEEESVADWSTRAVVAVIDGAGRKPQAVPAP